MQPQRGSVRSQACALWFLLGAAAAAPAQDKPIDYRIPSSAITPRVDGVYHDEEWRDALHVALTNETHPAQNIPALVATDVYLKEDGEHLLVAFVATDPEPAKIRAFYRDRDSAYRDDFVGIVLDTFNDERRAFEFFVNPLGVQMDMIQDDVARREDDSWNALWDSAGAITATGFVVELRIPLKQLRFPSGDGPQVWGIDLLRFYPRDVRHRLSNNFRDYSVSCYLCQLKKAEGFANLDRSSNLQLIPTMTSRWQRNRPRPGTDAWRSSGPSFEPSADLRWGINEDLVLNATINPDFSQVEADNAQLDVNTTFSLFFPKRREFFLDGADYFNTISLGNNNNNITLVHTRNIHSPDYGVKLTGKTADHTYAVLFANDGRTGFLLPGNQGSRVASLADTSSTNLALRYRYDLGRRFTAGVLGTRRQAEDYHNTLASADLTWRIGNSNRVSAQLLRSASAYPLAIQTGYAQPAKLDATAWSAGYSHQGRNFTLHLLTTDYGRDFRADLGFLNKVNYRERIINPGYTWRPAPGSLLTAFGVWGQWDQSDDQDGRELEEEYRIGVFMNGPWQSYAELNLGARHRFFNGRYFDETTGGLFAQFQPWGGAQFRLNLNGGRSIDFANTRPGDILTIAPGFTVQLGRHLQAHLNYNHQELKVTGGRLYATDLIDLRLTWQFSNRSFVRAIAVSSDTRRDPSLYLAPVAPRSRSLSTQLLYSYRFNAQTRFFIGYSDRAIDDPAGTGLAATNHTVFAKLSVAWQY
ncbi:MAG: carbohydrate binding family 9 domain-containing protein [Gammaproteobacteria bacterium]|nr:carbohydrate binding family 9 domain-containing protein [Gammaproteobacteria bacterium]